MPHKKEEIKEPSSHYDSDESYGSYDDEISMSKDKFENHKKNESHGAFICDKCITGYKGKDESKSQPM